MKDLDESLMHLAREIAPPRDLWPEIAARLAPQAHSPQVSLLERWGQVAVAASVTLVIGASLWAFREPVTEVKPPALQALGPAYLRDRERLLDEFPRHLAALPVESREKVAESLRDIQQSLQDIDAALAQDSGNALLQELFINTCQDEMRVLIAVQEAGASGRTV